MPESPSVRLSAFVGRSFLEEDKEVWHDLRDILESLRSIGFVFEDAKESQIRPISDKVREFILRNKIYIGLLTRRHPIAELTSTIVDRCRSVIRPAAPKRWTTSEWVLEEIGFAIGKDRPVLLLIEEGVEFPTSDLDADTEWVRFRRKNLAASQSQITSMIGTLIGKDIPVVASEGTATDAPPIQEPDILPTTLRPFPELFEKLKAAASMGDFAEAERVQADIEKSEVDTETRKLMTSFLLSERARYGDVLALNELKSKWEQNRGDFDALGWLSSVYTSFGDHRMAEEIFERSASYIDPSLQTEFAAKHAGALCRHGRPADAIDLLRERLQVLTYDKDRIIVWKALVSVAEDTKDRDLEIAFLEKVLEIEPTNHNLRFRLAWLYSDANRYKLATHHYRILVRKVGWENASNNLAVAYEAMGLKASQVSEYLKVYEKHELAKANIATVYSDAGFLDIAETYAKSVLQSTDDNASARAQVVLGDVAATRAKEAEAIQKIGEESRTERQFFSDYANAYCGTTISPFSASYRKGGNDIHISVDGATIRGSSNEVRESSGLLGALLMNAGSEPHKRRHVTAFSGSLVSRAGTFEMTTEIFDPPDSTSPESTTTKTGLLIFEPDLQSIKLLERDEKRTRIVIATRYPANIA